LKYFSYAFSYEIYYALSDELLLYKLKWAFKLIHMLLYNSACVTRVHAPEKDNVVSFTHELRAKFSLFMNRIRSNLKVFHHTNYHVKITRWVITLYTDRQ